VKVSDCTYIILEDILLNKPIWATHFVVNVEGEGFWAGGKNEGKYGEWSRWIPIRNMLFDFKKYPEPVKVEGEDE
jgi:hypothetical protein